jgi:hypothetical protein
VSFNAASLKLMAEKGLSLDDVIEIAAAMEARSKAAERQSRYRHRKKARDVTDDDVTRDVTPVPKEYISNPPSPSVKSDDLTSPAAKNGHSQELALKPEHVIEAWNAMAERTGLPAVRKLDGPRGRRLATLIRRASIEDFTEAIDAIERSPWMHGANDRGWRADFDFMINPSKFTKLVEGSYDRTAQ